jgi:chemotaxis response regulator CheB
MTDNAHANDFPIVIVGASAGGLQAIQEFLVAIPDDSPIAYIVLQHSTANSQLTSILEKDSPLPIALLKDEETLQGGKVYVAPARSASLSMVRPSAPHSSTSCRAAHRSSSRLRAASLRSAPEPAEDPGADPAPGADPERIGMRLTKNILDPGIVSGP